MEDAKIDRLTINYINARKSWEAWCFLNNLNLRKSNSEIRNFVDNNELLKHCRYLLFKDLHIELYKILKESKNNQDNVFSQLGGIHENDSRKINADIHLTTLKEQSSFINQIINLRDKYYSHLDKGYEDYIKNAGSAEELNRLFQNVNSQL